MNGRTDLIAELGPIVYRKAASIKVCLNVANYKPSSTLLQDSLLKWWSEGMV